MTTEAQKRAQKKYDDANKGKWRMIHLKLNKDTDAEIIEKLDNVANIQGYIKELIKEDIKNDVFFKARQKYGDDLTCDKCEYITGEYEADGSEFHICCDIMEGDGYETCINYYRANHKRHWNCPLFK